MEQNLEQLNQQVVMEISSMLKKELEHRLAQALAHLYHTKAEAEYAEKDLVKARQQVAHAEFLAQSYTTRAELAQASVRTISKEIDELTTAENNKEKVSENK
ncbi:MAG TPA: hypothetical protein VMV58_03240 [Desulfosporosinus sp.]|nr:hypothetical protein [Desulfosporosinus sp.]